MTMIIINKFGQSCLHSSDVVPRVGDIVDRFYDPPPIVTQVLLYPSRKRLDNLGVGHIKVDAIVTVE